MTIEGERENARILSNGAGVEVGIEKARVI